VVAFDLADRGQHFPGDVEGEAGLLVEEQVVGGDVGERCLRGGGVVDAAGGGAEGERRQKQQADGAEQRDADQSRSSRERRQPHLMQPNAGSRSISSTKASGGSRLRPRRQSVYEKRS
jgi:hypothetical protein